MRARMLVGAALVALLALVGLPGKAEAAGVTTHAWMAEAAIPLVEDPDLRALLEANREQVLAGGHFPDTGYFNDQFGIEGGSYGEETHWQRFHDAYIRNIRADATCGELTDPTGPCADRIAHMLGAVAHGVGDEVWDWLFEPRAGDFGERWDPNPDDPFASFIGSIEGQMDFVVIREHDRDITGVLPTWPYPDRIQAALASIGRDDVTVGGLDAGYYGMGAIRFGEAYASNVYYDEVRAAMSDTADGIVDAPGGIAFAASAIAPIYDNLWQRLLGEQPATEVGVTYPADGATGIPAAGWANTGGAGPNGRGSATRIVATLTYSPPYVSPDAEGANAAPAGSMTLTDVATGEPVPLRDGYPRHDPYGADAGAHQITLQPAGDLEPCTVYEVAVTDALVDADGEPVVPHTWRFRTDGCCPPAPAAFSDVDDEHPFADDIAWMAEQCISTGFGDGTYRPAGAVTRQAMSAFMFRLAGSPIVDEPDEASFGDVGVGHPFFAEIEWMAAEGISTGFGDGTYRPAGAVTRAAMSAFMHRLADGPGVDPAIAAPVPAATVPPSPTGAVSAEALDAASDSAPICFIPGSLPADVIAELGGPTPPA